MEDKNSKKSRVNSPAQNRIRNVNYLFQILNKILMELK